MKKKINKIILFFVAIITILIIGFGVWWQFAKKETLTPIVKSFEECVAAGNPVMESYPRQCRYNNQTFIENIGNELEKADLIRINTPRPNSIINSPLIIKGEARGVWFFEASFPVVLIDWDGKVIAQGIAQAKGEWMTTEFVPFEAKLIFTLDKNTYSNKGTLILKKDNPSGLPEHDDLLEIPVVFTGITGNYCSSDSQCAAGNLCHKNICTSPINRQCNGEGDTSCPVDFECIQSCGPPVVKYPDDTPQKYFCQLKRYIRNCPICLAKNTLIDTPLGQILVQELKVGVPVWTVNKFGQRVSGVVSKTNFVQVHSDHKMVNLILNDGRNLLISPGHPTINGSTVGDLITGDLYNGAIVISSDRVSYGDGYTYDLLPSGETGFYFANGILLNSTLH